MAWWGEHSIPKRHDWSEEAVDRWVLDHLPSEVGGPVYFCSSGVYVNGKRMGLQTAWDLSQGPAGDSSLKGLFASRDLAENPTPTWGARTAPSPTLPTHPLVLQAEKLLSVGAIWFAEESGLIQGPNLGALSKRVYFPAFPFFS